MNKEFNLIEAIRIIIRWKKHIGILTVVSAIIAALFSVFVMDEYFYSWSTLYPTNQAASDRSAIFNTDVTTQTEYFGTKADVNRVLTIANSVPIIEFVIDSFRLAQHYDIDTTSKYWHTKVRKKFEKNYSAIKTEHDAVEISVYDTDPRIAADIVNVIVARIDAENKHYINTSKRKTLGLITDQIAHLQQNVNECIDTLATLGQQYKIMVEVGADGSAAVQGNDYKAVQLYKSLLSKQTNTARELNNLINIKGQYDVSLRNSETSLYVLENATPADRRTKPVRSLVVLVTVLITFFVSVIGVLLIEQIREIKAQL